jgi:aminomethyltransferase
MIDTTASQDLRETPLAGLHRELGARMVSFAGYAMPVQYPSGILTEHRHVRHAAGLFDVSHMGQALLVGPDHATTARALEALAPGDFQGLGAGRVRYTLLLNSDGGIIDDLMVTRPAGAEFDGMLVLVVNAGRKVVDYAHLRANLPSDVRLETTDDRALLAIQGPKAAEVVTRHCPGAGELGFMTARNTQFDGLDCALSRSGYTGEDGYEISVRAGGAEAVARALHANPEVLPVGLGARDSLRLEAGLPLYGHDIDETTSPVEADLGFAISKRRRAEGGFPGADRILCELGEGVSRKRIGLAIDGKAPAREGNEIHDSSGRLVGAVTSGGYGATIGGPIAMGYVESTLSAPGTILTLSIRGKNIGGQIVSLPFVPHRYYRKAKSQ